MGKRGGEQALRGNATWQRGFRQMTGVLHQPGSVSNFLTRKVFPRALRTSRASRVRFDKAKISSRRCRLVRLGQWQRGNCLGRPECDPA